MRNTTWKPALPLLGVAALVLSSCGGDASATDDEESASGVEGVTSGDAVAEPGGEESEEFEDGGPQPHDLYADPLPPGSEDPPIYDYETVPSPETPFDHAPIEQAFLDALDSGTTPDETGLIEFDQPITELSVNGETFTIDGVIDPGSAMPLYEDQLTQGGVGPLAEELTGIPWHDRREDILRSNATATNCSEGTQHLWVAFDADEDPTCFKEPGGVTDPYFRGISAVCRTSGAPSVRTVYMGFGGEHSFEVEWGDQSGWDMMYRGPSLEGDNSCYAFTLPVRGATTE